MPDKIGLIVGSEWSFPPAFIEEVRRRDTTLGVEYVKIGTPNLRDPVRYSVILDRFSHAVPFYRAYLAHAAERGVRIVNDPRSWLLTDRFSMTSRAGDLGISVPRTIALPHREYAAGIVHEESLRNLDYPLDWRAVVEHVGLPCLLRDALGQEGVAHVCHSEEELLEHYNASGQKLLIAQEIIPWQQYVRCFVVGEEVLPLKFDPVKRKYHVDHAHLTPDLGLRIVEESRKLVREFGLDINTIDWAVRDGIPYAVEVMNPVPEIDIYALTPEYFDWVVEKVADHVIGLASGQLPAERETPSTPASATVPEIAARAPRQEVESGNLDLAEELPSLARDLPHPEL